MQRLILVCCTIVFLGVPARAQKLTGDFELVRDESGKKGVSQYIFLDGTRWNALAKAFFVEDRVRRGEFAFGRTLQLGQNTLKLRGGGTTYREVMLASLLVVPKGGAAIIWIVDAKVSTTELPSSVYQKLFVPITKGGHLQFRAEDLFVGGHHAAFSLGGEYRRPIGPKSHVYFALQAGVVSFGFHVNVGLRF